MNVSVIGIGRVGLPLALYIADKGYKVFGIDVNPEFIKKLEDKELPFIEAGAKELLDKYVGNNFIPTLEQNKVNESEVVILTLGTPVDEHLNPDYKQIENVLEAFKKHLKENQLIVLRSTVAPGTTEYIKQVIEKDTEFKIGENLFLAFCPERIAEGKAIEEIKSIPQIIGGMDEKSKEKAKEFFKPLVDEYILTDSRSAEMAKIFTNMYRYINFAIANEFLILAEEHERDVYEIINLVNHNYKRGGLKLPGFTAGPCLYKDGFFLVNAMPFNELISVSWKINETLPLYLLKKIKEKTELEGKKVALLGMTFKADVDDTRNSLSFKIKKALERENIELAIHDPVIRKYQADLNESLKDADVVIFAINHSEYRNLDLNELKSRVNDKCLVCDIWNLFGRNKIIYEL